MEDLLMKSVNKHYFPEKERKELAKEGRSHARWFFSYS
jgi:hypothetical protein